MALSYFSIDIDLSPSEAVVCYLEAEGVQGHGVEGGDVEVERRDAQLLQPGDELQELPRQPPDEHLEARVPFRHSHLDVGHARLGLHDVVARVADAGAVGAAVSRRGDGGVLWESEEACERGSAAGVRAAAAVAATPDALLDLERLEELLQLLHVVDCAPNDGRLVTLINQTRKNQHKSTWYIYELIVLVTDVYLMEYTNTNL